MSANVNGVFRIAKDISKIMSGLAWSVTADGQCSESRSLRMKMVIRPKHVAVTE
jgi:hypothetical protein